MNRECTRPTSGAPHDASERSYRQAPAISSVNAAQKSQISRSLAQRRSSKPFIFNAKNLRAVRTETKNARNSISFNQLQTAHALFSWKSFKFNLFPKSYRGYTSPP
jgi:hypothetical protein